MLDHLVVLVAANSSGAVGVSLVREFADLILHGPAAGGGLATIAETTAEQDRGSLVPQTPKSKPGRRTVAFPVELVPELRWHLDRFAASGERA